MIKRTNGKRGLLACAAVFAVFGLTDCSTIHFIPGEGTSGQTRYDEWHHIGVLELVEFSDPVDMAQRCEGNQWSKVTTSQPFIHGLIEWAVGILYSPYEVRYACEGTAGGGTQAPKKKPRAKG